MISVFPVFKKIEIQDKKFINDFIGRNGYYSNFHFTTLFCWDVDQKRRISLLNGNLVVKTTDDLTGEVFYTFFGSNDVVSTTNTLFDLCQIEGMKKQIRLIPHETATLCLNSCPSLLVKEDRNNFDHVYKTSELATYCGSKFATPRNMLNRFNHKYKPGLEVKYFNLSNENERNSLMEIWQNWITIRETYTEKENKALSRLIENYTGFDLCNVMLFIDGKPAAFTINEIIDEKYAISHFAKANYLYSGITAALLNETAKCLEKKGCQYLNYEEDMGLPKLRYAKESFRPALFLKKYSIEKLNVVNKITNMLK